MSTTPSQPTSAQPSAKTKTYQEKITQDLIVTAFKAGRESGLREGFALGEKEGLGRGKRVSVGGRETGMRWVSWGGRRVDSERAMLGEG
jgi:hypothetical protein